MRCSLTSVFIFMITIKIYILEATASLYSPDDPLWELDNSNFHRVISGKTNAWIVEFYLSWCGHCIRFAPKWKNFARDIQNWKNVIDIAVVNCAESQNVALCRDYGAVSYPSIKLFWTNLNETNKGEFLSDHKDVSDIEQGVITYLESNWQKGVPSSWPDLRPLNVSTIEAMWNKVPETAESIIIIVESSNSSVGSKVILDLSAQNQLIIRRLLSNNTALTSELQLDASELPLVVKVSRSESALEMKGVGMEHVQILERFSKTDNTSVIRDKIYELIVGRSRINQETTGQKMQENVGESGSNGVYMTDLENALHYSFHREIGVHKDISDEKLSALKAFILALKLYFPGNSSVMSYLTKLNNWASHLKGSLSGEEFLSTLNSLQDEKALVLSEMSGWVGCKGTGPQYRGYPCSLWTLFHTLTVQAFNSFQQSHRYVKDDSLKLLRTIRDYVKYFFTCQDCSQHFQGMAESMENEVKTSRDVVLWMWNAHNKVNKRLAGDVTEDPGFPKIQFPSREMCPKCRISTDDYSEISWDSSTVLKYLQHFYKKELIVHGDHYRKNTDALSARDVQLEDNSVVINFQNVSFLETWNFKWFTSTDISLCVSLYLVSALLLVIIYILFQQRRRRRRIQFAKILNLYP